VRLPYKLLLVQAANGIDGATLSDPDLSEGDFQEVCL
jgi:hypothetical protein